MSLALQFAVEFVENDSLITRRGKCGRWHQPATFIAKGFPVCLNLSLDWVTELRARRVNLLSAVASEIRHATYTGEIAHFANLLNSSDTATTLPGTRHAQ